MDGRILNNKRKRSKHAVAEESLKKRTRSEEDDDHYSKILLLESKILDSRKNYNSITTLLNYLDDGSSNGSDSVAAVALCRIFCRLMAAGEMTKAKDLSENSLTIVQWLVERRGDFSEAMLKWAKRGDISKQNTASALILRLMREDGNRLSRSDHDLWTSGVFIGLIDAFLESADTDSFSVRFIKQYANEYDDIRYYALCRISDRLFKGASEVIIANSISMLTKIDSADEKAEASLKFFIKPQSKPKKQHDLRIRTVHMKQAQQTWLDVLRQTLNKSQRKQILEIMSNRVAPWFLKTELLMDFLTDSFDIGGSTSLMALSGLFYLIQNKNLDYPHFYEKLYSLLDANILHSKHRSRFFRLLDTFLSSTHLPAALVASFMKRLSRLCLYAPPSGIVVVIPWIYNLLKSHPTCTFMIHRIAEIPEKEERGWADPFRMEEPDPMDTDAIESSLWEIETLQSHYHPNVATIAKIISEQFTKHAYNIEDFLDHSYATMLDGELIKSIKKPPEIEYEIPKRVFGKYDVESGRQDSMLVKLWNFSPS